MSDLVAVNDRRESTGGKKVLCTFRCFWIFGGWIVQGFRTYVIANGMLCSVFSTPVTEER